MENRSDRALPRAVFVMNRANTLNANISLTNVPLRSAQAANTTLTAFAASPLLGRGACLSNSPPLPPLINVSRYYEQKEDQTTPFKPANSSLIKFYRPTADSSEGKGDNHNSIDEKRTDSNSGSSSTPAPPVGHREAENPHEVGGWVSVDADGLIASHWRKFSDLRRKSQETNNLDSQVLKDFAVAASIEQSTSQLKEMSEKLETALQELRGRTSQVKKEYEEADAKYKRMTGCELDKCKDGDLSEIADSLWLGLQAASVTLSRTAERCAVIRKSRHPDEQEAEIEADNFISQFMNLDQLRTPPEREGDESQALPFEEPEKVCDQIIQVIESIRDVCRSMKRHCQEATSQKTQLKDTIDRNTTVYIDERAKLRDLVRDLKFRNREVGRLTGQVGCDDLDTQRLSRLCAFIRQSAQRLAVEQAFRKLKNERLPTPTSPQISEKPQRRKRGAVEGNRRQQNH